MPGNNASVSANSINANSSIIDADSSKSADPDAPEEEMLWSITTWTMIVIILHYFTICQSQPKFAEKKSGKR